MSGLKMSHLRYLLLLVLLLAGLPFRASAQNATIVGTVTDPSGSVVANVKISITHMETNLVSTFTTNEAGQYVAVDVPIGHYNLKAEASGFKAAEHKNLVLQVGDRTRVDFQLVLGAASETVTVEANAVRVQADSGEVSNVIDDQQMSQIAVNGRSIYQLAALAPGASSQINNYVNTPVGGDAGVEFNGMRQNHNIYLLDGGEDDDRGGAGGMSIAPSTDAIAEFRQLTSNYSADYGLSSAGTMTMVLKSGSSTLHASAWEFNRNDALDARDFFKPAPAKIQELRLNVYGFNVGGPVTFGKLYNPDKKKTFFFYNMEWRKLINGGGTNQTVPDTATYGGNLSGLLTASKPNPIFVPTFCGPGTAAGPCTGTNAQVAASVLFANCPGGAAPAGIASGMQFPGNVIPSCMINPNASALLSAGIFPAPTTNIANGIGNFVGGANAPTNLREEVVRIDHNFTSKFSVFGHYIAEQVTQNFATSQWSGDNLPTVGDTFGNPSRSGVIHTTYAISPTLLNEVAFNYNGNVINIVPYAATGLKSLALPTGYVSTNSRLFTGPNNLSRIPNIDLSGGVGANFEISSWPWHNKADDYQIRDDISLTKGAHQLKFGASWAIYKKVQDLFGQTQGGFGFSNALTAGSAACPANTACGNSFASFLLGLPNSYQELAVQDHGYWNNVSWAAYVQDNWRVNKRLTLNLGLRWDGVPHTYEANNRMGNFYPSLYNAANAATFDSTNHICSGASDPGCTAASPGLGTSPNPLITQQLYLNGIGIPGQNGVPKGLVNNHWAAFGPRLGFAYDLTGGGKTVVRGGFGIMYERIQGNDMYNAGPNIPFSLQVNTTNVGMTNPGIALSTGAAATLPINAANITGLDVNGYKLPVSYQWSAGVQHSLSTKTVLSVSYVGNQGRHQNDVRNINLPPAAQLAALQGGAKYQTIPGLAYPGFTSINLDENEANTHYNGLQIDLNSQLSHDLNLRAFYTLSRAIDPTTAGNGGGDLGTVANPYAGWKYDNGPSGYDRTHIAVVDFIYDIPLFRHNDSKLVKSVAGGWQVSGIVTMESGLPINVNLTGAAQNFNGTIGGNNRPNLTGTVSYPKTQVAGVNQGIQYFDPTAFTAPTTPGTYGTLGHNALRGPGRDNWNISLFKSFTLSESRGSRFELRFESFNTWNHTQFNQVDTGLGDARFGRFTSAFDPRILQLGGKIYF
ncbi:MAG TPA: carboxypeptidase-like regulatory domain-containing protein [Candidatus Acidoferrum sp.]|nr:carboxypeptidase-like regulatory domain-containing protein [Candidatus Acidoferrum sp.]